MTLRGAAPQAPRAFAVFPNAPTPTATGYDPGAHRHEHFNLRHIGGCPRFEVARHVVLGSNETWGEHSVATQSLAEMFPNLTGPKISVPDSPSGAAEKVIAVSKLRHLTILPLRVHSIVRTADLCSRFSVTRQGYFDAQLMALMIEYSLERIYTENTKDFGWSAELGIEAVNPLT